jgi:hypothetical protein
MVKNVFRIKYNCSLKVEMMPGRNKHFNRSVKFASKADKSLLHIQV